MYVEILLTKKELCHTLAVEPSEDELDTDNLLNIEDPIPFCAGLVTVDKESKTIHLVHYTTQEYFERIRGEWSPSAQLNIASTCLRYLPSSSFKGGTSSTDRALEERRDRNPLLDYAASHWAYHTFVVQQEVPNLARKFLRCYGFVSCAQFQDSRSKDIPKFIQQEEQHYTS
jgi:hypothetical protein